jgi:hypothetical protein
LEQVRASVIALTTMALFAGVNGVATSQPANPAPTPTPASGGAPAPPAVLERPDLSAVWQPGMALRYHRTSPGPGKGDFSRDVLEEFTKTGCPLSPCSKWHGYYHDRNGDDFEEDEYFDGEGNLFRITPRTRGYVVRSSCYPRYLRFPLKVPSDARDGCSAIGFNGNGADHADYRFHYEWERVRSTYTGADPVWAVHLTIKVTCNQCVNAGESHRYYYPQKAVWILRIEEGSLYDLVSIGA